MKNGFVMKLAQSYQNFIYRNKKSNTNNLSDKLIEFLVNVGPSLASKLKEPYEIKSVQPISNNFVLSQIETNDVLSEIKRLVF